jgi:hypothetical protein
MYRKASIAQKECQGGKVIQRYVAYYICMHFITVCERVQEKDGQRLGRDTRRLCFFPSSKCCLNNGLETAFE